jgi:hypothetical protein
MESLESVKDLPMPSYLDDLISEAEGWLDDIPFHQEHGREDRVLDCRKRAMGIINRIPPGKTPESLESKIFG